MDTTELAAIVRRELVEAGFAVAVIIHNSFHETDVFRCWKGGSEFVVEVREAPVKLAPGVQDPRD